MEKDLEKLMHEEEGATTEIERNRIIQEQDLLLESYSVKLQDWASKKI